MLLEQMARIAVVCSLVSKLRCIEIHGWIIGSDFLIPWHHHESPVVISDLEKDSVCPYAVINEWCNRQWWIFLEEDYSYVHGQKYCGWSVQKHP